MEHEIRTAFVRPRELESAALEGFDEVGVQLERALSAVSRCDATLAARVVAFNQSPRPPVPRHPPRGDRAAGEPGARGRGPAPGRRSAAHRLVPREDGRPVREHRQAGTALRIPAAAKRVDAGDDRTHGAARRPTDRPGQGAYISRDVELAGDLALQDSAVDQLNRQVFRRAVDIGDDVELREWAMFMVLIARALERIGDNTVDVAEQTVFLVTGELRELTDAPRSRDGRVRSGPDLTIGTLRPGASRPRGPRLSRTAPSRTPRSGDRSDW